MEVTNNKPNANKRSDGAPTDFAVDTSKAEPTTTAESEASEGSALSREQVAMAGSVPG